MLRFSYEFTYNFVLYSWNWAKTSGILDTETTLLLAFESFCIT